jgi:type IV pilus assembly protein PilM
MFKLFESHAYPIGIDVGTHAVRFLQFKRGAGEGAIVGGRATEPLALQAACRVELSSLDPNAAPEHRYATALAHAFESANFAGRSVVLSLPVAAVQAKSVRLPQMPDPDLAQALQWEAADRFGFEVAVPGSVAAEATGKGQLVWFRAGEVRRGTEVKDELLLFAVNGGVLHGYLQALVKHKMKIAAVDIAPCALYRSVRRAAPAMELGTAAMLDLGHAGAQFFIVRDGELVFYKHIDIGGRSINAAVAAKLGITPEEAAQMRSRLIADQAALTDAAPLNQALRNAMRGPLEELARELDMCMRYYVVTFRGARPETIALTGRQASCPDVRETLAAALGLQVEEAQPLRGVENLAGAARPDRSGEWAAAAGLSLYTHAPAAKAQATEAA